MIRNREKCVTVAMTITVISCVVTLWASSKATLLVRGIHRSHQQTESTDESVTVKPVEVKMIDQQVHLQQPRLELAESTGERSVIQYDTWNTDDAMESQEKTDIPESLRTLVKSVDDLKGRHSDYVNQSECKDLQGKYQWNTSKNYDFIGPFAYLTNYKNPCFLDDLGNLKCVPYFYIIGAPKSGSTDIYLRLARHPQVLVGLGKEIRWFDRRRFGQALFHPKYKTFEGYLDFFSEAIQAVNSSFTITKGVSYHMKVIGDGSPTYYFGSTHWRKVPGNEGCSEPRVTALSHIHHLWPHAKLLLVLRNPVTRLYSSYLFNADITNATKTPEEFHEWTEQALTMWNQCLLQHSFRYCMYDGTIERTAKLFEFHIGLYSRYILDVIKLFPMNQLMVVHLEDYSANTKEWMDKIFTFLELESLPDSKIASILRMKAANANNEKRIRPMLDKTKKLLEDFFLPFNRELADIMNDKKYLWMS